MSRSEALIRAQKKYYENKRSKTQKTISITLTAEQAEADRKAMKAHNTTPARVWREAMERLNAAPVTPSESGSAEESQTSTD